MNDKEGGSDAVLIIDDEESARCIAKQHFRGRRHRLIEAPSGIEGAEWARFERPKLIFRQSDYERLFNRHVGILPKGEDWPPAALEYRTVLDEPDLLTCGMHTGRPQQP